MTNTYRTLTVFNRVPFNRLKVLLSVSLVTSDTVRYMALYTT